jgi:hypothetical protein
MITITITPGNRSSCFTNQWRVSPAGQLGGVLARVVVAVIVIVEGAIVVFERLDIISTTDAPVVFLGVHL